MAREHAHRLHAEGIDLETIRLWLIPCTALNERNDILATLASHQPKKKELLLAA